MRVYTVVYDECEGFLIAIAADTAKEARRIAYHDERCDLNWLDIKPEWKKDYNASGLEKGVVSDVEGLKRGFYVWVEMDCPKCGEPNQCYLQEDGTISCNECA